MDDRQRMRQAAAMFFDHFCISPDRPDRDSLQIILSHFSSIPWENLTKFLMKAQQFPEEKRLRLADTTLQTLVWEPSEMGNSFDLSDYYEEDMGTKLTRQWFSFMTLRDASLLAEWKLICSYMEEQFLHASGNRRANYRRILRLHSV